MRANHADLPHVVYRAYSYDGTLLYVGITHQFQARMAQHRASSTMAPWYLATVRVTTQEVATGTLARKVEAKAVRDERPIFNVVGSGRHSPMFTGITYEPHAPAPPYVPRHAMSAAA